MRRLTVSSLFPRGDHLEEDAEKETSRPNVSFSSHHVIVFKGQEGALFLLILSCESDINHSGCRISERERKQLLASPPHLGLEKTGEWKQQLV